MTVDAAPPPPHPTAAALSPRAALRRLRIAFALLAVAAGLMFATSRALRVVAVDRGDAEVEYRIARLGQGLAGASLVCLAGVVIFGLLSRVPFPGYVLSASALLLLSTQIVLDAPGFRDVVVLGADRFLISDRDFLWTPPREIHLSNVAVAYLRDDAPKPPTLVFIPSGDGPPIEVRCGTVLNEALPELKRRAASREIEVIDDID